MAGRKKKPEEPENSERWLITYSDLITLLMIFFLLMYTMSKVDAVKYKAVANSLSVVLNGDAMSILEEQGPSVTDGNSGQQMPEGTSEASAEQGQLTEIKRQIEEFIRQKDIEPNNKGSGQVSTKLSDSIVIIEQERGLVISFKDTLLFASASDALTPAAREIIKSVGESLVIIPNYIRVEGHTDNIPIHTSRFPSNWELSVMRASNVIHVLQQDANIPPNRLSAIGYGAHRPLVSNDDKKGRAMNRRVDIVILKQKYDYFEPPAMAPQ